MRRLCLILPALLLLTAAALGQAAAAPLAQPNPAEQSRSYKDELGRLAEILGSLHYLSNLCAPAAPGRAVSAQVGMPKTDTRQWRDAMAQLLAALRGDAGQSARLAAAFNRAYQALADGYASCSPAAREALARCQSEGQSLSDKILEDFGSNPHADE